MSGDKPRRPVGLRAPGRRLWDAIVEGYDLDEQEVVLLVEACRTADACADLDEVVRREGVVVDGPQGPRGHPALVEGRQQRLTLGRLLAQLRLPDEEDQRPQRRGGARGPYSRADGGRGGGLREVPPWRSAGA